MCGAYQAGFSNMELDWSIPDEIWIEYEEHGLAAQVQAAQTHWAKQCQPFSVYQLLDLYKHLTEDFYDARLSLRHGGSGDTASRLDRKRLAVVIAIGSKLTEDIDHRASQEFDRRCQGADQELDRRRQWTDEDIDKVLADLEAKVEELEP
jgi:hypothetical protein